jgi:mitotic-spindle organizing protein 1
MKTPYDASSPLRRRQNNDHHHHHHKNDDDHFNRKNNENNFEADDCFDGDRISSRSAQKHLEITHEISKILECDLDRETLAVCISMLQNGVEPESLALVVKELKREAKRLRESRERAIGGGGGGMR